MNNQTCHTQFLKGGLIKIEEIDRIISKMKLMKACGWDEISNEHLKNAGPIARASIAWLLNKQVTLSSSELLPGPILYLRIIHHKTQEHRKYLKQT